MLFFFISALCTCNSCYIGKVFQLVGHRLLIGSHACKGWEPILYV